MKDRQPTQVLANGAIRYGIYSADGTLDHYEYMKREDEPTIEGTPLNKANLLSDVTENKIWNNKEKPADPTVNDALYELSKGTARIGDISMTARGDRSASWLPCDGRSISNVEYPDLYNVLRTDVDAGDWDEIEVTGLSGTHPSLSYVNGYWFCVAQKSDRSLNIAVSSDFSSFEIRSMSVASTWNNSLGVYSLFDILGTTPVHYYAGKYLFAAFYLCSKGNSYGYATFIVYSDTPAGTWSLSPVQVHTGQDRTKEHYISDLLIYDGIYYIPEPRQDGSPDSGTYYWATDIQGQWTRKPTAYGFEARNTQAKNYGAIYSAVNNYKVYKFQGLNDGYVASSTYPGGTIGSAINLAAAGDTVILICGNGAAYSLDGGETFTSAATFGSEFPTELTHNIAIYDGNICATFLKNGTEKVIAVTSAPDFAFAIKSVDYEIGWFANNGNTVSAIVDNSEDVQVKLLTRDFSYSAKRIPKITPDGRSYAYIKALEE